MKILLVCITGKLILLLAKKLNEYMRENNIEGQAIACSSNDAKEKIGKYDVILLAPQVRTMIETFKALSQKPVGIINPTDYALADGEKVFKFAKKLSEKRRP